MTSNKIWWVYVVRRADGALYTGTSLDVARRLAQHRAGRRAKALRGRGPLELMFRRRIGAPGLALRIECAMKRLPKAEKECLLAAPRLLRSWLAAITSAGPPLPPARRATVRCRTSC